MAILGAGLAAISDVWTTSVTREKESELLFVGAQYRRAIARYYENTPGGLRQYPSQLEDLLLDPRFPEPRRYLRDVYPDPITGTSDWVLIKAPQGGIMGIASASESRPLKTSGFVGANSVFEPLAERLADKLRYRDWEFVYDPAMRASVAP
ncbi:MAG: type II secretion system protein [Rhodocyclaceae bacterium]|nr:type II secretion system protein [Rhodocyclaceae bacterium]